MTGGRADGRSDGQVDRWTGGQAVRGIAAQMTTEIERRHLSVCPSIRPSIRPSARPPAPSREV